MADALRLSVRLLHLLCRDNLKRDGFREDTVNLDLIVRGGQIVTPQGPRRADLGISGGQIVEVAEEIGGPAVRTLDASGLHVFPGVLDAHVHLNEPGRTHWEGFETGTRALAAGGATSFFDMPLNSSPPVLDRATFEAKRLLGEQKSLLDFGLWGGLTPLNLDRLDELADAGVIGFKAFMSHSGLDEFPAVDDTALYEGLRAAARLGLVVATHAESDNLTRHFTERARAGGGHTVRDYLGTRPVVAELEAVQRALLYAGELGAKLHLVHLSSGAAVAMALRSQSRRAWTSASRPARITCTSRMRTWRRWERCSNAPRRCGVRACRTTCGPSCWPGTSTSWGPTTRPRRPTARPARTSSRCGAASAALRAP